MGNLPALPQLLDTSVIGPNNQSVRGRGLFAIPELILVNPSVKGIAWHLEGPG
jgi:hypothetical protein